MAKHRGVDRVRLALCAAALALAARTALCQFAEKPDIVLSGIPLPLNVAAGDLNGDGKADLLVSSWSRVAGPKERYDDSKGRVLIFYQKDGAFRAPTDRELAVANPMGLAVGDFDNDGKNDLAVAPYGALHIFLGRDNLAASVSVLDKNGMVANVWPCKLNKAGLRDFLSGPVWIKWLGQERFDHGYVYGPASHDNRFSLPADLNNDGEMDILVAPREAGELRVYYGPLLSMAVRPADLSQFVTLAAPLPAAGLAVGDLNGDGRLDIVAPSAFSRNPEERKVVIYFQNAPLGFTEKAKPSAVIEGVCGRVAVADVNGDGLDDLAVAEAGAERLHFFLQENGKPLATSVKDGGQTLTIGNNHAFALADLNGDGLPDLVHSDGRSVIRVFLNRAARTARDKRLGEPPTAR